jgi:hypothetical protein
VKPRPARIRADGRLAFRIDKAGIEIIGRDDEDCHQEAAMRLGFPRRWRVGLGLVR